MKIGELASRAGFNASALRYYEKLGVLAAPLRASGQRRYASDSLNRALLIRFARDMGFTLNEVKVFLNGLRDDVPVGPRWRKLAHRKIEEVDATIRRARRLRSLLAHLLECKCATLQVCVQRLSLSPNLRQIATAPKRHSTKSSNHLKRT